MKLKLLIFFICITLPGVLVAQENPLYKAICDNDLTKVKRLIRSGHRINSPMKPGKSYPLELASYCYGGAPRIVSYLLKRRAKVNLHSKGNYSNLMWAIRSMNNTKNNPMRKNVFRMIRMGANVKFRAKTTGRTALMLAAGHGDTKLVRLLLNKGVNKSVKTRGDWCISDTDIKCNASDYARLGGHVEVSLLIQGKSANKYKKTLHYAVKSKNTSRVQRLLKSGANINEQEKLSKLTPLHYAVETSSPKLTKLLIDSGAKLDVKDYAGITPLRNAIVYYKSDIAKMLIDAGARADNTQDQGCGSGLTEYNWALSYRLYDIAEYIIAKKAVPATNKKLIFTAIYGSDYRAKREMKFAKYVIAQKIIPNQENIDQLEEWQMNRPSKVRPKLIALYNRALKNAPTTNVQVTGEPGNTGQTESTESIENWNKQFRSYSIRGRYKSESSKKTTQKTREFERKYSNKRGLDFSTDLLP